jgi:fatty acid desaturase
MNATTIETRVQTSEKSPASRSAEAQHPSANAWAITKAIREADRRLRDRFPLLRHQSAIGMGFVLLAYGAAAGSAWLYLTGSLPALACILVNAVCFAVLREIEHDLIHNLYFTGKRALQNLVLFLIWPALGNVPSPLYRRMMHLQHHRSSGREDDLEERLIGNGTRYGFMRLLTMFDTGLSTLFRRKQLEKIPGYSRKQLLKNLVPVVAIFYVVWVSFLLYHAVTFGMGLFGVAFEAPAWLASLVTVIDALAIVWVLPNVIRQACLQVLSSTMHYYGDVKGIVQQTQVLSKWYWLPLQLLTCNFGKSHAIHHFVVNQPFYLRELVRRDAHAAMRRHGVRFDDVGTFARANRWGPPAESN